MTDKNSKYYLVREEILPEAIKKTIKVKELLKKGEVRTINEAVEKLNLSRSAYYKYKDYVFPFYEASKEKIVTLTLLLEHRSGVLSKVLNVLAAEGGSVLTINQGIPLQGVANATLSLETVELVKQEIRTAQYRATVQVNGELLRLYHAIGTVINAHKVWGSKFVENLAADILKNDAHLAAMLAGKCAEDPAFAKDADAQLEFVFQNCAYHEPEHMRYPVYRLD